MGHVTKKESNGKDLSEGSGLVCCKQDVEKCLVCTDSKIDGCLDMLSKRYSDCDATEWSEDLVENHEEKEKVTSKSISKEAETLITKNPNEQSTEHLEEETSSTFKEESKNPDII